MRKIVLAIVLLFSVIPVFSKTEKADPQVKIDSLQACLTVCQENEKIVWKEYNKLFGTKETEFRPGVYQTIKFDDGEKPIREKDLDPEYKKTVRDVLHYYRDLKKDLKKQIKNEKRLLASRR